MAPRSCDAELCPMWDGHGCPCAAFDLDPDDPPTDGVFSIETPDPETPTGTKENTPDA